MLRHFGVLEGEVETRESLGLEPAVIVRATDEENYLLAPESGLWETLVEIGDRVEPGQLLGRIHFIERPDREPEPVHAQNGGFVCSIRGIATTDQGDKVAVVGREIDVSELA